MELDSMNYNEKLENSIKAVSYYDELYHSRARLFDKEFNKFVISHMGLINIKSVTYISVDKSITLTSIDDDYMWIEKDHYEFWYELTNDIFVKCCKDSSKNYVGKMLSDGIGDKFTISELGLDPNPTKWSQEEILQIGMIL